MPPPHALITGASSGIGEALALVLGREGYRLTLVARREGRLQQVARRVESTHGVEISPTDLADLDAIAPMLERAQERLGPVDLLVNNAGMEVVRPSREVEPAQAEELLRLNLLAPTRLTGLVLPHMAQRGTGSVVNIASVAAYAHPPLQTYYSASKAGLAALSNSLSDELRKQGVHVLTVYPGPIKTEMGERIVEIYKHGQAGVPWGTADVLAQRILTAVQKRRSTLVYPRFYWLPKLFPELTRLALKLSGRNENP